MIIHKYGDGSEGYQYEIGDRVIVERTIHGGWFDIAPVNSDKCIVHKISGKYGCRVDEIDIKFADDWGTVSCFPWMLKPHTDTVAKASIIKVSND
ncbi:MAG: hypothetical protein ACXW07_08020 [Nitrososphaeraceae archaeon]